jgi:hypothetical protein
MGQRFAWLLAIASLVACRERATAVAAIPLEAGAELDAAPVLALSATRFESEIRPLLAAHGCAAASCHGTFKGGGLFLKNSHEDFESVAAVVDVHRPDESLFLRKALRKMPHVGGRNLSADGCDTQRIVAWIAGAPSPACTEPAGGRTEARFEREMRPALQNLGCTQHACHGAEHITKLDLSHLDDAPAQANASLTATGLNRIAVWRSPVVQAALGELPGHAPPKDPTSCAIRRLYGYVADSPEEHCATDRPLAPYPDRDALRDIVMPMLARRGCTDGGCHGDGAGEMSLFDPSRDKHAALHDYLVLTARVEPGRAPADTTLLQKTRNEEPHGGGTRLGGEGDCFDAQTVAWIQGKSVHACARRAPPVFSGFQADIQGVLDRMTCSQTACHGGALERFKLIPHAQTDADLRANYAQTLAAIDLDYMPFSPVMLRMREPCAYSVTGAWIEGKPRPTCTLVDPDPKLFPRVAGMPVHPPDTRMP